VAVTPAGEPLIPGQMNHEFDRLTAKAGLPRIRSHDLRHSTATLLIEQGQPIPTVARMLGHDPAMTARVYSHVTDSALDSLSATFSGTFG
jgi:site-specific recombinase XerD